MPEQRTRPCQMTAIITKAECMFQSAREGSYAILSLSVGNPRRRDHDRARTIAIPDLRGTWTGKGKSIVFGTHAHHPGSQTAADPPRHSARRRGGVAAHGA